MIKLTRSDKPEILTQRQTEWQNALDTAINKYGSYKDIPQKEKDTLISHYRHTAIKDILFASSNHKCAFCEGKPAENGHIEVEHFKPKSIYPELTFEWSNFLPSCKKCNLSKLNHDTGTFPIVNPYISDPEDFFFYEDIRIKAIRDNPIANDTIEICGLNAVRLMVPRGELLANLHEFAKSIGEAVDDYNQSDAGVKKTNRLRKIAESINTIDELTKPESKYSAYCKHYLENCAPYIEAKRLVFQYAE